MNGVNKYQNLQDMKTVHLCLKAIKLTKISLHK